MQQVWVTSFSEVQQRDNPQHKDALRSAKISVQMKEMNTTTAVITDFCFLKRVQPWQPPEFKEWPRATTWGFHLGKTQPHAATWPVLHQQLPKDRHVPYIVLETKEEKETEKIRRIGRVGEAPRQEQSLEHGVGAAHHTARKRDVYQGTVMK